MEFNAALCLPEMRVQINFNVNISPSRNETQDHRIYSHTLLIPLPCRIPRTLYPANRKVEEESWDPSVKTLHSLLSPKFWRHFLLSGETPRHSSPNYQREEMNIFNISFPRVESNPQPIVFTDATNLYLYI